MSESGAAEDRAKKFMMDAARLAEELRAEQDNAVVIEKERREMEARAKDLQVQLDDAETNAIKWGRKMVAKLESRGRELEAELDSEQRRCGDAAKNFRKAERMIREYTFKADEDKKNSEKLQDLIEKLQQQIKTYKKQIEEAEEIASLNLAKFRKAQLDLADTSERADLTEQVGIKCAVFFRNFFFRLQQSIEPARGVNQWREISKSFIGRIQNDDELKARTRTRHCPKKTVKSRVPDPLSPSLLSYLHLFPFRINLNISDQYFMILFSFQGIKCTASDNEMNDFSA